MNQEGKKAGGNRPFRVFKPFVAASSGPPRIPRRKCGCKRAKNNPNLSYLATIPNGQEVSAHRVNYFNKPGGDNPMTGGIKHFLRKNDCDAEITESFYPTSNDMMRKDESDSDSDMPALRNPKDLPPCRTRRASDGETVSLETIRHLLGTHAILIDNGTTVSDTEDPLFVGPEKTFGERSEGLRSEQDERIDVSDRYTTGEEARRFCQIEDRRGETIWNRRAVMQPPQMKMFQVGGGEDGDGCHPIRIP